MPKTLNIIWPKTKKNVENVITQYMYYNLSVDNCSACSINEDFLFDKLEFKTDDEYVIISSEERKKRIDYINYFRFSFNKLTKNERKIIYWTYIDKEDSYDDRFIANSLGFSLGYYYIKKKETLIRFAYSLGVEVSD